MNARPQSASTSRAKSPTASTGSAILVVSLFGLLPMGLVTGMMLMQILGIWPY